MHHVLADIFNEKSQPFLELLHLSNTSRKHYCIRIVLFLQRLLITDGESYEY